MKSISYLIIIVVLLSTSPTIQSCPSVCDCIETTTNCSSRNLTNIPKIPSETTHLILSYNRVTQDNLLDVFNYDNVQVLNLEENGLTEFPFDRLQSMNSLTKLFLGGNLFTEVPSIHHLSLVELSLRNNGIITIERDSFTDLVNLRRLDLSNNKIQVIEDRPFPNCLQELNLDSNSIANIELTAFQNLKQLQKLSLFGLASSFSITKLETLLGDKPQLTSLQLGGLEMSRFSFSRMGNLETLSLRSAKIHTLPRSVAGLTNLSTLDLSGNELVIVPDLSEMGSLKSLDLSSNRIEEITNKDFIHVGHLEKLNFSHNVIREIDTFHTLHIVQIIDLSFNLLSGLSIDMFNSSSKLYLSLHHNPWKCTCTFARYFFLPLLHQSDTIELICKTPSSCMECAEPYQHRGLTLTQNTALKTTFNECYPHENASFFRHFTLYIYLLLGVGVFLLVLTINMAIVCTVKKPKPSATAATTQRGRNSVRLTSISYRDSVDLSLSSIEIPASNAFAHNHAIAWDNNGYASPIDIESRHTALPRQQLSHGSAFDSGKNASLRKYVAMRSFATRNSSTTSTQVDHSAPTSPFGGVVAVGEQQDVKFFPSYGNVTFDAKSSCKDVYLAPSSGTSTVSKSTTVDDDENDDKNERSRFGTYVEIDFVAKQP